MEQDNIMGLVLCGGLSARMGQDKGLLKRSDSGVDRHRAKTWAEEALQKLERVCPESFISLRREQGPLYLSRGRTHLRDRLIFDQTEEELPGVFGPLRGLLSAYRQGERGILALAADLPAMEVETLRDIARRAREGRGDMICFRNGDYLETLCAYYSGRLLGETLERARDGRLKTSALKHLAREARADILDLPGSRRGEFRNINSPEDREASNLKLTD